MFMSVTFLELPTSVLKEVKILFIILFSLYNRNPVLLREGSSSSMGANEVCCLVQKAVKTVLMH
jgi:hypothetical protein